LYLILAKRYPKGCICGVDYGRLPRNLDAGCERADLKSDIYCARYINQQLHVSLHVLAESLLFDTQRVSARRNGQKLELAGTWSDRLALTPLCIVYKSDFRAGDSRMGLIKHRAV